MKKKLLITGIALALILAFTGGSMALRTVEGTATSTVTASNVRIELNMLEKTADGTEKAATSEITVVPGEYVSRIAAVRNTGSEPAWVRIKTDPEVETEFFQLMEVNGDDWTYQDGCWYYNEVLKPGDETSALFQGVQFSAGIDNEMSGEELTLKVNAEATQSAHNGDTVLEASGWPGM